MTAQTWLEIPIYATAGPNGRMPQPHRTVIVEGGIAVWTGSVWLSQVCSNGQPIQWPVKWWSPLIHLDDVKAVQE